MRNEPDLTERDDLELKENLDPTAKRDQLRLVKEIVAMANTKGGRILIGVTDDGKRVGVPDQERYMWEAARIGDLLEKYIDPDRLEVSHSFRRDGCPPERMVVELVVPQYIDPPLVICRDTASDQSNRLFFRKGAVLVRNNTRVEPAARSDFVRWRKEDRSRILEGVSAVILDPDSVVQVAHEDVNRDTPSYLLSRSVHLFRRRPDKLLDGNDLLYLFTNRAHLDTNASDRRRLLLHSALRRRATLFFWLARLDADPDEVAAVLDEALKMRDRDKSDMSGAVPLVAALFLSPSQYQDLIARMTTSRYAHIRRAASGYPELADARAAIEKRRGSRLYGRRLSDFSDEELLDVAERTIEEGGVVRISRQLSLLGIEYLVRRLSIEGGRRRTVARPPASGHRPDAPSDLPTPVLSERELGPGRRPSGARVTVCCGQKRCSSGSQPSVIAAWARRLMLSSWVVPSSSTK